MMVNVVGDGSAGQRHARMLRARGHVCTVLGPEQASPVTHSDCDAVVIASPPHTHKLYLSWYKDHHILCEGPVTWLPPETARIHMTASNWRFVQQIQWLQQRCMHAQPTHAQLWFDYDLERWRPAPWDYKTSCYYTDGIDWINVHEFDLAQFILGPITECKGLKYRSGKSLGVDTVCVIAGHESGTVSTINSSWHCATYTRGIRVWFRDGSMEELGFVSPGDDPVCNASYEAMVDAFCNACADPDYTDSDYALPPHAATLEDGYAAFRLLHPTGGTE